MNAIAAHLIQSPPAALRDLGLIMASEHVKLVAQPIRALQAPQGPAWYELLLRADSTDTQTLVMTAEVMRKAAALDIIVARNAAMVMIPNNVYSINVSGQSVSEPHFGMHFWNAIRPSAVEPSALVIEITETAQITDIAAAKYFCDLTREYGARIAIDDVSGADLPLPLEWVDFLKIDGIRLGGLTSRRSGAIIHALMRMAEASERIRVVAEGVENAAELESMAIAGVHYWQGHYQDGAAKAIL